MNGVDGTLCNWHEDLISPASLNVASHFLERAKMKNQKKDEPNLTVTIELDSSESFIQDVFRKKVF